MAKLVHHSKHVARKASTLRNKNFGGPGNAGSGGKKHPFNGPPSAKGFRQGGSGKK